MLGGLGVLIYDPTSCKFLERPSLLFLLGPNIDPIVESRDAAKNRCCMVGEGNLLGFRAPEMLRPLPCGRSC